MATFKIPTKKKQKKGQKLYAPVPIPFNNTIKDSTKSKWCYYHGEIIDGQVMIQNSGDAFDLLHFGCFGKILPKTNTNIFEQNEHNYAATTSSINVKESSTETFRAFDASDKVIEVDSSINASEVLCITLYESFFLSYGIGCLFLKNNKVDMTISDQWSYCCDRSSWFPIYYAAYHHFRGKGWVPKDGIRYGADFLLYRKGPPYFHASYVVVIRCINAETLKPVQFTGKNQRTFSWETLSGLLRLSTTVSKEILFCYVAIPSKISSLDEILPDNLKDFIIYESIVSRWVSSKEREKELLDIDCDF